MDRHLNKGAHMNSRLLAAVAVAASVGLATPAAAVTFAGGAQGCFVAPGPGSCSTAVTDVDNGLAFTGGAATFTQSTDSTGFAAVGGPANNFGTLTLAPSAHSYSNDLFNLLITFTLPAGSGNGTFTANLLGSLTSFGVGGVQITFQNPDQTISSSIGDFLLHVNSVSFSGSPPVGEAVLRQDISGYLVAAVPEPGTWGMMLLGFAGIGLAMRRRRPMLAQVA
jgi:hypothetical protein